MVLISNKAEVIMEITHIPENAQEMEFEILYGDDNWEEYGGKWISPKLNNGDFDYWLVLEFINWLDATGELYNDNEFLVELTAVSPDQARDELDNAYFCNGFTGEELAEYIGDELDRLNVECLSSYGVSSNLWSEAGNDADALLKKAKQAALVVSGLFGFFMDSPQNRIGSTGWDTISGDLLAGLNRV